jgi:muramoyltetrapeptide carboxypeptidase
MKNPVAPHPLKKGDTVAIAAPAGQLSDVERFFSGIKVLEELGFKVVYPRDLWPGNEYLADIDNNRGSELNRLFADPDIDALISLRGGYGSLRMIDKIDVNLITAHPKMFIGFSDITILQNYLFQQTGLISLHGPVVTSVAAISAPALERFALCLAGRWDESIIVKNIEILRNGRSIVAPLIGGNLASLTSLLGTPYDFSWDHKIVFLEDINEPTYKVDRMLTQLHLAGKLNSLAGLIIGDFSGCYPGDNVQQTRYLESIWNRILELCGDSLFPVWANFPSGHCCDTQTLPLGANALMQGGTSRLIFPKNPHRI